MEPLVVKDGRIIINVTVVPKSSRDSIVGILGDTVKVAVTAPPVDGKANAYVCKFLAGLLLFWDRLSAAVMCSTVFLQLFRLD